MAKILIVDDESNIRITSYNVCYTKLLRSGDENHEVRKSDENDIFADSSDTGFIKTGADEDKNRSFIENAVSSKEGLIEHLLWQARMSAESEHLYQIYEEFITSLNEDGFRITSYNVCYTKLLRTF